MAAPNTTGDTPKFLSFSLWYIYLPLVCVFVFLISLGFTISTKPLAQESLQTTSLTLPTPNPFTAPSEQAQKWYLATGAILSVRNRENFDQLSSNLPVSEVRLLLYDWWGVSTREDALDTLKRLKRELHGRQFRALRKYLLAVTNN